MPGFAFVLNPFHCTEQLPIELIPGVQLERADPVERETIEELRGQLGRLGESLSFRHEPIQKEAANRPNGIVFYRRVRRSGSFTFVAMRTKS